MLLAGKLAVHFQYGRASDPGRLLIPCGGRSGFTGVVKTILADEPNVLLKTNDISILRDLKIGMHEVTMVLGVPYNPVMLETPRLLLIVAPHLGQPAVSEQPVRLIINCRRLSGGSSW